MKTRILILALEEHDEHAELRGGEPLRMARLIEPTTMREIGTSELGAYEDMRAAIRQAANSADEKGQLQL